MKLYATVTSERASKGQGGNKFIDVSFQYETAPKEYSHIGTVTLNDAGVLSFTDWHGNIKQIAKLKDIFSKAYEEKGEKQKGDYHKCKKHEERTRECKFYSFQNDPCSEI